MIHRSCLFGLLLLFASCASAPEHDLIVRNGLIVDGTGSPGYVGDLAIDGDRIAAVGDLGDARGVREVEAWSLLRDSSTC